MAQMAMMGKLPYLKLCKSVTFHDFSSSAHGHHNTLSSISTICVCDVDILQFVEWLINLD